MEYKIKFSQTCLEEIDEICNYITVKLKAENASNRLRVKIMDNVLKLQYSPQMYAKIEKKDRLKRDYRKIVIDNYVLLYCIMEQDQVVLVSHMYYCGKNYLQGLI